MLLRMEQLSISTRSHAQVVNVTRQVEQAVAELGVDRGSVIVFVPHTTAGITIQESADPDVVTDVLRRLEELVPWSMAADRHREGNTAAHVKAAMMGTSVTVLVEDGRLKLGTWQGIWFCEFDGPRSRKLWVDVRPH